MLAKKTSRAIFEFPFPPPRSTAATPPPATPLVCLSAWLPFNLRASVHQRARSQRGGLPPLWPGELSSQIHTNTNTHTHLELRHRPCVGSGREDCKQNVAVNRDVAVCAKSLFSSTSFDKGVSSISLHTCLSLIAACIESSADPYWSAAAATFRSNSATNIS
jgi:hypothetical protein